MDGYPNPLTGEKLEYLFGACYLDEQGHRQFKAWWAHNSVQEKQAFNDFIAWVDNRRLTYGDLNVYQYASYELTAIGERSPAVRASSKKRFIYNGQSFPSSVQS